MSAGPASPTSSQEPDILSAGTVVGGRFRVESRVDQNALITVVRAKDDKTNRPIALNLLSAQFVGTPDELNVLREEVKQASKLKHRSMLGTYGLGTHGGKTHFIACEWVEGVTLDQLVQQRRAADHIISVRGAYNLLAHVCKALASAHETTVHGAIRPSIVWVADNGKVKVGNFGIGLAMVKTGKWALLDRREQSFLAPEVHNGSNIDARADVFGVGALLYVLLTGRSPDQEFVAPSRAHPDASEAVDQILMRCLAGDPAQRYASPSDVIDALMPLVSETQAASDSDIGIGIDIEVDVDVAASVVPPAAAVVARVAQIPRAAKLPQPFSPAPAQTVPRPSPSPALQAPAPQPEPEPEARRSELDLHSLVAEISRDDAPRWIANKEGLDYGPFSGRELVALIVKGEVLEQHALVNLDTGERRLVREYPEFAEFVQQYKIRKAETDHQDALVKSDKVEKRANVAKFTFLAAGIGVLLLAGAGYLITRNKAAQEAANADASLAAFESGQVKITGTAGILKHTGGGGGRKRVGSSGPGGAMSYEDAMNQAVDLGDAKSGGGERQLTSGDVAGVMNSRLNSLFGCVSEEIRRGGKLGTVKIDLAIAGSGTVLGTSVNAGSPAFQGCIAGKTRSIRFPSFPAPRMGARYSFNVD